MKIAVVADDLTSATDGGIAFAQAGHPTTVALSLEHLGAASRWDVVSIDADSRIRSHDEAIRRVHDAVFRLRDRDLLYKTVDSTIRGHLAGELGAALRASGRHAAIFAPAFPEAGRITRGGRQLLDGVGISATAFANDPLHPVQTDDIASILSAAGGSIAVLDRASAGRRDVLESALRNHSILVVDAETPSDLRTMVRAVPEPTDLVWIGSPGLARALAEAFPGHTSPPRRPRSRRVLVAIGSVNPVSREQLEHLRPHADLVVEVDAMKAAAAPEEAAREAVASLGPSSSMQTVVVTSTLGEIRVGREKASLVAESIAAAVRILHAQAPYDGFVLTGGDTAIKVARALDATGIVLESELSPGIPIGAFVGRNPARVITKAGGFGDGASLTDAWRHLTMNATSKESAA
ncbi:four-carbon acid sugar kinase family protein [Microvirga guangxiensis]|nr:four-carbon acid sugar kinase family protein [Microvirga guangxiensis]